VYVVVCMVLCSLGRSSPAQALRSICISTELRCLISKVECRVDDDSFVCTAKWTDVSQRGELASSSALRTDLELGDAPGAVCDAIRRVPVALQGETQVGVCSAW
jgi:hypothetical protein